MQEALYYERLSEERIECLLCPHNCIVRDGNRGICQVRINQKGVLFSDVYGRPAVINLDPIEKKPLFHFYPGYQVLSIGTMGCNLKCSFCQNCEISQASAENRINTTKKSIKDIVGLAKESSNNIGLAYTYNEPVIFYEYMSDLAIAVQNAGMKNIMISNGFINQEPLSKLLNLIDAFNIDLKSFSNEFYIKYTNASLDPVLKTIKTIYESGRHFELTFLVIPGLNDDTVLFDEMTDWIVKVTNRSTVLHLSRYFPRYKMNIPPTPVSTMEKLFHRARKKLDFVYMGNMPELNSQNSYCPNCQSLLIKRNGYFTSNEGLDEKGFCVKCREKIISYLTY